MSIFSIALAWPIRFYRFAISPMLGVNCRFDPTCSAYALQALARYGALRGSWLAAKRILRCHPWGGHGADPVPQATLPPVTECSVHADGGTFQGKASQ